MQDPAVVLQTACDLLLSHDAVAARELVRSRLPRESAARINHRYSKRQLAGLFTRDRFTDRYSGKRLIFPGTLRLLSVLLPDEFPHHVNWKFGEGHPIYWELCPTLDHLVPTSRGGRNDPSNWITTSMVKNAAKAAFLIEELGWQLYPPDVTWDGLTGFFLDYVERVPAVREHAPVRSWLGALRSAG